MAARLDFDFLAFDGKPVVVAGGQRPAPVAAVARSTAADGRSWAGGSQGHSRRSLAAAALGGTLVMAAAALRGGAAGADVPGGGTDERWRGDRGSNWVLFDWHARQRNGAHECGRLVVLVRWLSGGQHCDPLCAAPRLLGWATSRCTYQHEREPKLTLINFAYILYSPQLHKYPSNSDRLFKFEY